MSFSSDWLFPPDQSRQIVDGLLACGKPVSYSEIQSSCGHDAFLLENDYDRYGEQIRAFLENVHRDPLAGGADDEGADSYGDPKNIFHASRLDYDLLLDLVPPNATVLDVGCGTGGLLVRLKRAGHDRVVGVERDERAVTTCLRRGVEVIRADLNDGLSGFGDGQFDYVLLSHTLQAVRDVPRLLDDILRVGRRCVVTFPNFAYRKLRDCLARDGRAPVSEGLLRFEWYETPNIRFFSILDFQEYCRQRNIRVQRFVAMDTEAGREVTDEPNLNADMAIFVISR
jgi:homoserine O-acetyltransferase